MNGFEEFIDFLASKGVKSFHIEMQSRELSETQERNIERAARTRAEENLAKARPVQDALAKHDIPVYRGGGHETVTLDFPMHVAAFADVEKAEKERLEKETEEMLTREERDKAEGEEEGRQLAAEKAIVTAEQDRAKQPVTELSAKQANASVKADGETTGAIAAGNIDPKKLYDHFCAKIAKDDGTFTVEERTDLIGRMGLDDLLRINNDFSLGLDTDKAVDDVREDVKNCFQ